MRIFLNEFQAPAAGARYAFGVGHDAGGFGPIEVGVDIGDEVVLEFTCSDPPCYQIGLFIHRRFANREMRIQAVSAAGETASVTLRIGSSEPEAGAASASSA